MIGPENLVDRDATAGGPVRGPQSSLAGRVDVEDPDRAFAAGDQHSVVVDGEDGSRIIDVGVHVRRARTEALDVDAVRVVNAPGRGS